MSERLAFTISAPAPTAANKAVAMREGRAVERTVDTFQQLLDQFTPDDLATIAGQLEGALQAPIVPAPQAALVAELTVGRAYSREEQVALELSALVRSFRHRRALLADALTVAQVAELLGTSRQTPHDRVRGGSLLAVLDRGVLRFPAWQFDPEGPDGVVLGLPAVLRALQVSPLAKANWLTRPNPYLEGETPLAALKRGETERVVGLARAVGVN